MINSISSLTEGVQRESQEIHPGKRNRADHPRCRRRSRGRPRCRRAPVALHGAILLGRSRKIRLDPRRTPDFSRKKKLVQARVAQPDIGAGDRDRTGDIQLGKLAFYR